MRVSVNKRASPTRGFPRLGPSVQSSGVRSKQFCERINEFPPDANCPNTSRQSVPIFTRSKILADEDQTIRLTPPLSQLQASANMVRSGWKIPNRPAFQRSASCGITGQANSPRVRDTVWKLRRRSWVPHVMSDSPQKNTRVEEGSVT